MTQQTNWQFLKPTAWVQKIGKACRHLKQVKKWITKGQAFFNSEGLYCFGAVVPLMASWHGNMVIYTVLHNLSRHSVQQGSVNKCVENLHVMLKKANIMFLVCEGLANIENDFCTQLVMNEIILQTFRFQPGRSLPTSTHTVYTIKLYSKLLNLVAICTRPHYNVWNIWPWNICVKTFTLTGKGRQHSTLIMNRDRCTFMEIFQEITCTWNSALKFVSH